MQKIIFFLGASAGVLLMCLVLSLSPLDVQGAVSEYGLAQEVEARKISGGEPYTSSCANPDISDLDRCQQLEAEILDVTLRLEMTVKNLVNAGSVGPVNVSVGHATVVDGRFLVTHNHFAVSPDRQLAGQLLTLSAYRADGRPAIRQAPSHTFKVFIAGSQTLVFDFGQYGGQGAFDYMGLTSARLGSWQALGLHPGMEVAQVNWDGQKTFVDWVRVSSIGLERGVPVIQLNNYVEPGASGGGVFYAGYHLANNWYRDIDKHVITGRTLRRFTAAALNGTDLIALTTGDAEPTVTEVAPLPTRDSLLNLATMDAFAN